MDWSEEMPTKPGIYERRTDAESKHAPVPCVVIIDSSQRLVCADFGGQFNERPAFPMPWFHDQQWRGPFPVKAESCS